jgi:hypothetical protein
MSRVTRFCASLFSYVFHPLFISSYVMAFLIFVHPVAFSAFDPATKKLRFLNIVLCNVLFPAFAVFLMWKLKLFIQSIFLRTEKERIIPYVIAMVFYWWTWDLYHNWSDAPPLAVHFLLGSFLALCGAWVCNIYFKISMHTIAMGSALMFFFLFSFSDDYASGLYLSIVLVLTGLVATSRLIVSDHSNFEIWSGVFIGMLAQFIGWQF